MIGREIVKDIVRKGGIAVNADIHVSTDLNKREIYVDISDEQSVREVIRTVCQKFGRIDGLVNCAIRGQRTGERFLKKSRWIPGGRMWICS